jgi:hypothetical protein
MQSGWKILVLVSIAVTLLASEANALFDYRLEHMFTVLNGILKEERIGPVPEGMLNNFSFTGGGIEGPKMRGRLRSEGWGRLLVRTDGVGILDVHAAIETDDGALVAVTCHGRLDLGEDGYQKYLASGLRGFLPGEIPLRMVLHFHTTHPNYLWLNRLQGLGIGLIEPARPVIVYNVYAVR